MLFVGLFQASFVSNSWFAAEDWGAGLAGTSAVAVWGVRPRIRKCPAIEIRASAAAHAMNTARMPSFCARYPESRRPNTWDIAINDMKVLLTRPTIAGGVSCCDMVCAGIQDRKSVV